MIRSSAITIFAENINAQIAGNGISGVLVFKIFWGSMPPYTPRKGERLRRSNVLHNCQLGMTTQISLAMLLTIDNIKKACTRQFKRNIGAGMVCDILAGNQGPSCRTVKQIPNLNLIHVQFIPESEEVC